MLKAIREYFDTCLILHGNEPEQRVPVLHLAAATLLMEVLRADHDADPREIDAIAQLLRERWNIDQAELDHVLELAAREAEEATSLYQFTSLISDHYTPEEKTALIEALWQVAYADQQLHHYEEHLIRRIADLLHVPHRDFIRTKLKVQESLG